MWVFAKSILTEFRVTVPKTVSQDWSSSQLDEGSTMPLAFRQFLIYGLGSSDWHDPLQRVTSGLFESLSSPVVGWKSRLLWQVRSIIHRKEIFWLLQHINELLGNGSTVELAC
jgi:hypothetical protein